MTCSNKYSQNIEETRQEMASNLKNRPKKRQKFFNSGSEDDGKKIFLWYLKLIHLILYHGESHSGLHCYCNSQFKIELKS